MRLYFLDTDQAGAYFKEILRKNLRLPWRRDEQMRRILGTAILVSLVVVALVGSGPVSGQPATAQWLSITDLGTLDGNSTQALAINDHGQIVGYSGQNALLWEKGQMNHIGQFFAIDINNRGQVVGEGELWERGEITDLRSLGESYNIITAINDRGRLPVNIGPSSGKRAR
jgi:hypothetical protein